MKNIVKLKAEIPTVRSGKITAGNAAALEFELHDGDNCFESVPFAVADRKAEKKMTATVTVRYSYMDQENAVILAGSRYSGTEGNSIAVKEKDSGCEILCISNSKNTGGDDLEQELGKLLAEISERLVADAESKGLDVYVREDLSETMKDYKVAYKDGIPQELFCDKRKYGAEYTIVPLTSSFGGVKNVLAGEAFYNVIGSSPDKPDIAGSWIDFWSRHTGKSGQFCTVGNHTCSYTYIGGHIVFHKTQQRPKTGGKSGIVAILPICQSHNKRDERMIAAQNTIAVWLKSYIS